MEPSSSNVLNLDLNLESIEGQLDFQLTHDLDCFEFNDSIYYKHI